MCTWIGTKQTLGGNWYIEFGELLAAVYVEVSITDFHTVFAARGWKLLTVSQLLTAQELLLW